MAGPDATFQIAKSLVSMVMASAIKAKATHVLVAFDGPQNFRYDLWPLYKANRTDLKYTERQLLAALTDRKIAQKISGGRRAKGIYDSLDLVLNYLEELKIKWVQPQTLEADDVMASVSALADGQTSIVLGTADKDIYQCLAQNVRILSSKYSQKKKKMVTSWVTESSVPEIWGVEAHQMIDLQTVIGDPTDMIIGVPGYGKTGTAKALTKHDSLAQWMQSDDPKGQALNDYKSHLQLNRKLVTLRTDAPIPQDLEVGSTDLSNVPDSYAQFHRAMKHTSLF